MSEDIVARVGGAILLAETEWTPKSPVSKERAMAIAAIEAMREPTRAMLEAGAVGSGEDSENTALGAWEAMIDAARAPSTLSVPKP